jgi:hypothetical protein
MKTIILLVLYECTWLIDRLAIRIEVYDEK